MEETPFVNEMSRQTALEMESLFLKTPQVGVLFVSVRAYPVKGGTSKVYEVALGLDRGKIELGTGLSLIKHLTQPYTKQGIYIWPAVHLGQKGPG